MRCKSPSLVSVFERLKSNRTRTSALSIETFYFDRYGKPIIPNLVEAVRSVFKSPHLGTRILYLGPPNETAEEGGIPEMREIIKRDIEFMRNIM